MSFKNISQRYSFLSPKGFHYLKLFLHLFLKGKKETLLSFKMKNFKLFKLYINFSKISFFARFEARLSYTEKIIVFDT
jgi:hypothetical protein